MEGGGRHFESNCFNLDCITDPNSSAYEWKRELAILKLADIPGFLEYKKTEILRTPAFNMSFHIFGKGIETRQVWCKMCC